MPVPTSQGTEDRRGHTGVPRLGRRAPSTFAGTWPRGRPDAPGSASPCG
ncbi:MAG: hypothetical protein M0C28_02920 [Candidatus Moduliflexus flocculans]|nr:hypothetical protein [Candidatus Moduliflexus flocculans]